MASRKLPAFQFYPGDWMKDPALRACSCPSRGLWIDMICLMHESPVRGHLVLPTGIPLTNIQLSRIVGLSQEETVEYLTELEMAGVLSIGPVEEYVCKRMVRDEAKREALSEAGRRGGLTTQGKPKGGSSSSPSPSSSPSIEISVSEAYTLMKDTEVIDVWRAIPKTRQRQRAVVCKAIRDSIDRGASREKLAERVTAYYESPEGLGGFHRGPARWFNEDGQEEPDEAWHGRGEDTEKF